MNNSPDPTARPLPAQLADFIASDIDTLLLQMQHAIRTRYRHTDIDWIDDQLARDVLALILSKTDQVKPQGQTHA